MKAQLQCSKLYTQNRRMAWKKEKKISQKQRSCLIRAGFKFSTKQKETAKVISYQQVQGNKFTLFLNIR